MEVYLEAYVKRQLMSQLHITFLFEVTSLFLKAVTALQQCDTFRRKHLGYIKACFYFLFKLQEFIVAVPTLMLCKDQTPARGILKQVALALVEDIRMEEDGNSNMSATKKRYLRNFYCQFLPPSICFHPI